MKIAILSDTHGRHETVRLALEIVRQRGLSTVLHCGDIDDPDSVSLFAGFDAHFVFGNCDTERLSLQQAIHGIGETLHRPFGQLEIEGVKIAFLHGDDERLMREVEESGRFDFLFYGHTHVASGSQKMCVQL